MERTTPKNSPSGPPIFRSRYGGLWTDRSDAHSILRDRQKRGIISESEAESIGHYIDHGYVIFPRAVDSGLVDVYLALFEQIWNDIPKNMMARHGGKVLPLSREFYDEVAKVDTWIAKSIRPTPG